MDLKTTVTFAKTADVYFKKKYRQIVSMGGSRSSKTFSILQLLMLIMMSRKNIKITVWRDTKVVCRATALEDFKNIIMADYGIFKKFKENKQSGKFTYLPTGSEIVFEGADSVGKVLGGAQDFSYFNEITEFSKPVYLQITQRTAETVFADYNPSKDFWLEEYRLDPRTVFIHSSFKGNAYCPEEIVEQLLSYEPWEPGSYDIIDGEVYYKGAPITDDNQPPLHPLNHIRKTADKYMWLVYGLGLGSEKPNRIYKGWKKITPEIFDSLEYTSYFGQDFGTSNPTAIVEVKYDGDGAFYVYPRFYKPLTMTNDSVSTMFRNEIPSLHLNTDLIAADPAKQSYIDLMTSIGYMCVKALKGNGSIEAGIKTVQGFTIYYVEDVNFNKEYNTYSWEVDRYQKPTDNPLKKDDHYMDALRYIITYLVRYLSIQV